jgi:hypothetical protein
MSNENYQDWISRMYNDCNSVTGFNVYDVQSVNKFTDKNRCYKNGDFVIYVTKNGETRITNIKNGKSGYSRCNFNLNTFDPITALAIAWARYCKCEIPKVKEYLTKYEFFELKNGDCFIVGDSVFTVIGIDCRDFNGIVAYQEYVDNKELMSFIYAENTYEKVIGYVSD